MEMDTWAQKQTITLLIYWLDSRETKFVDNKSFLYMLKYFVQIKIRGNRIGDSRSGLILSLTINVSR